MDVGPQLQMQFPFVAWWRLGQTIVSWWVRSKVGGKLKSCPRFWSLTPVNKVRFLFPTAPTQTLV